MKKILCFILAAIMLLATLAACTNTPADDTDGSDTVGETEDTRDLVTIFETGEKGKYVIVYADDSKAAVVSAAQGISYQAEQKFKIGEIGYDKEYAEWGVESGEFEILIGDTTRAETAEAKKLFKGVAYEYVILLTENQKLVIVGNNQDATVRAINYFAETFITNNDTGKLALEKNYSYYCDLGDISNTKWILKAPKYDGGTYASSTYNIGTSITLAGGNAGKMQLISETSREQFDAYLEKLDKEGYTVVAKTENNKNVYVQLTKNKALMYTYYLDAFKEVRVIDDYFSDSEAEFEYVYEAKAGETTTYYQYGLMHDPAGGGGGNTSDGIWGNNGAFDIIKLADNKLILIDGGWTVQATESATAALVDFLYEITGTPEGEKITVAAWFLTHTHHDHMYHVANLARDYGELFVFERVMHNVPTAADKEFTSFLDTLVENNPDVLFAKLHTGQNITLGNINFDVIMTHEDATDPETGKTYIKDWNNTSTVLKFHINGKSVMYFGDWGGNDQGTAEHREEYANMENRLLTPYKAEDGSYPTLKADMVQIAHHAINDWMGKVYTAVDADYAFFSQADVEYDKLMYICYKNIINQLRATGMEDKHMYFAGRQTNWLEIDQNGNMTHGYKKLEGATEGHYKVDEEGNYVLDENGEKIWVKGYWDYIEEYGGKPWYDYGSENN